MTLEEAIEARHSVRTYKEQKFSFEYMGMKDGHHQVHAKKGFSMIGYTQMDLEDWVKR